MYIRVTLIIFKQTAKAEKRKILWFRPDEHNNCGLWCEAMIRNGIEANNANPDYNKTQKIILG